MTCLESEMCIQMGALPPHVCDQLSHLEKRTKLLFIVLINIVCLFVVVKSNGAIPNERMQVAQQRLSVHFPEWVVSTLTAQCKHCVSSLAFGVSLLKPLMPARVRGRGIMLCLRQLVINVPW